MEKEKTNNFAQIKRKISILALKWSSIILHRLNKIILLRRIKNFHVFFNLKFVPTLH